MPSPGSGRRDAGSGGPGHHAYLGGLLEHTVAVATMVLELCTLHPRLDRDLLLCAAIVHDLGKAREFSYGAEIARSAEGRLLGHVELGLRLIAEHAPPSRSPSACLHSQIPNLSCGARKAFPFPHLYAIWQRCRRLFVMASVR